MALIKCSECGKEFSDKASACPNCACPIETLINNKNHKEQNDDFIRSKTSNNKYYEKEIDIKTLELDFEKIKKYKNICIISGVFLILSTICFGLALEMVMLSLVMFSCVYIIPFIMIFYFKVCEKNELILTNKRIKGKIQNFGTTYKIDIPLDKIDSIDIEKNYFKDTIVIRSNSNNRVICYVKNCDEFRKLVLNEMEKYKKHITK